MPNWVTVTLKSKQYNLNDTKDTHASGGSATGIKLVTQGKAESVWAIDVSIWHHLSTGVLKKFDHFKGAVPAVSMKWDTKLPNIALLTRTRESRISSYNLLGSRIITLDAPDFRGGKAVQAAAKRIYTQFPGSFELSQSDPRHIGTHSYAKLGTLHKHIVKKNCAIWTGPDLQKLEKILIKSRVVTL